MSDSLQPHALHHTRLSCSSLSPTVCSNHIHWVENAIQLSHPLLPLSPFALNLSQHQGFSQWVCSLIQVVQNIGALTSASVLLVNIQGWFPLGLTDLISLLSKGLSRVFSSTTVQKHWFFGAQPSLWSQLSYPYMSTGETIALTLWTLGSKEMSLLFNMLSRFVITFLPRSMHLLILWLQLLSTVI